MIACKIDPLKGVLRALDVEKHLFLLPPYEVTVVNRSKFVFIRGPQIPLAVSATVYIFEH